MSRKTIVALLALAALGVSAFTPTSVSAFSGFAGPHAVHLPVGGMNRWVPRPVAGSTINRIYVRRGIAKGINPDG